MSETLTETSAGGDEPTKRDFLFLVTGAMGAVGVGAAIWPFLDQMNPDAATIAAGGPVDVDLSQLQPGQQIEILWQSHPVFVVNRPPDALTRLQDPNVNAQLRDPDSDNLQQPTYAKNWHRSLKPEILVLVGVCTHLGCIPEFKPQPDPKNPAPNWPGGYFCPCHGSRYDLAGRVFQGVPAPYNLPVPPHTFPDDKIVRVGDNPPGESFDFSAILQV